VIVIEEVSLEYKENIAYLSLGTESDKIPILTRSRMDSLSTAVEELSGKGDLQGLVICGVPEAGFCAGADVHAIQQVIKVLPTVF